MARWQHILWRGLRCTAPQASGCDSLLWRARTGLQAHQKIWHRHFCGGDLRGRLLRLAEKASTLPPGEAAAVPQALPHVLPQSAAALEELRGLARLEADRVELEQQRAAEGDEEVRALYDAELAAAARQLESAAAHLELVLLELPGDDEEDLDARDVILEVTPGVGGQEATLFALEVWQMYERLAERRGWAFEVETQREAEVGGLQAGMAVLRSDGVDGVFGWMCRESGVHRVQRIPVTDKKDRMQTSSAVVVVLPMAGSSDAERVPASDVRVEISKKSSGPGGQSVNAAHQAVRVTHIPTGLTVLSNQSPSQFENRKRAVELLEARLFAGRRSERLSQERNERQRQRGTGDRSEKIRTYNFQRDEVTDHRLDKAATRHSVQGVIFEEELDDILGAFRIEDRNERLLAAIERLEDAAAASSRLLSSVAPETAAAGPARLGSAGA